MKGSVAVLSYFLSCGANPLLPDNVKLYYEEVGEGRPVVFIHGWSCCGRFFKPIVAGLRDKYRCISVDLRGHGGSEHELQDGLTMKKLAQDLRELLEYLNLKDVILVGHSMGVSVILNYIGQFGCENIAKLALIDMTPKMINDETWDESFSKTPYTIETLCHDTEDMNGNFDKFILRFFQLMSPQLLLIPEQMSALVGAGFLNGNNPQVLKSLFFSMALCDNRPAVEKITVPLLYFHPEEGLQPKSVPEYFAEHAKAAVKIVSIPEAEHLAPVELPEAFIGEMKEFFA
ncbi:MAG: alpha/beta hydrolase [Oscillospiraceae bacterium]